MRTTRTRRTALAITGLSMALALASGGAAVAQDEAAAMQAASTARWDFDSDAEGWDTLLVDLPEDYDPAVGDLLAEWAPLPEGLEGSGLYTQGANQSDDLFMGWKVYLEGLEPATDYRVDGVLTMASNMPAAIADADDSPAEVYVKLGAYTDEPAAIVDDEGWLRLNADKGLEETGGRNAVVLGTIANPNLELGEDFRTFALHDLTTDGLVRELDGTSVADGGLWLFVGTDSGYAGFTTQFFDAIEVTLTPR